MSEGQMDSKLKINYSKALLMPLLNHYRGGQDKDFKILKAFHVQVCSDICWSPSPLQPQWWIFVYTCNQKQRKTLWCLINEQQYLVTCYNCAVGGKKLCKLSSISQQLNIFDIHHQVQRHCYTQLCKMFLTCICMYSFICKLGGKTVLQQKSVTNTPVSCFNTNLMPSQ